MGIKEISEEDIRRINNYSLNRTISRKSTYSEGSSEFADLEVMQYKESKQPLTFRFYNIKLVKYFVTKLSQVNFKRVRMNIKYGMKIVILMLLIFTGYAKADTNNNSQDYSDCIDEEVITDAEKSPEYNLLSFPAIATEDPYILAVSYFNSKLNIILRKNYVSQYEYSGVPYYIYKSFITSPDKKDYFKRCIKDLYEAKKVY